MTVITSPSSKSAVAAIDFTMGFGLPGTAAARDYSTNSGQSASHAGAWRSTSRTVQVPSLESLDLRYQASDQGWAEDWLKDEIDPCSPGVMPNLP